MLHWQSTPKLAIKSFFCLLCIILDENELYLPQIEQLLILKSL